MLEKNKDYVEFTLQCTTVERSRDRNYREVCFNGYSDANFPGVPMDVICKDFGHKVVMISKSDFERLQLDIQHYRELAKQWEENYNLLLEKTGFTSVVDLIDYICDPSMTSPEDKTLKEIIEECEEDYISERDKAETLQTENEQLKKKLHEFDPISDFKELFKKLYSIEDTEVLEWALNHTVGGRGSVNGWRAVSSFWSEKYKTLSKLVGFSSTEEIEDYLVNEAECDTLQEAISKLKDQVKYTCEEWYSANSRNNSWKAAAECNSPGELIEKLNLLRDDISGHDTVIESYERNIKKWQKATGVLRPEDISAASIIAKAERLDREVDIYTKALQEWKDITGCPSPSAAKTLIESGASWHHAYNESKEVNKKLADSIKAWQNVTGDATPEDYLAAMIKNTAKTVLSWQEITGFSTPEKCSSYIDRLEKKLEDIKNLTEED